MTAVRLGLRAGTASLLGAFTVIALVALVAAGAARADTPAACPDGPADAYTGSDDAAHEVRELRREQVQTCEAITGALGVVHSDTGPLAGALAQLHDDLSTSALGRDEEHPVHVAGGASPDAPGADDAHPSYVTFTADDRTWWGNAMDAIHGDVWFLIGALLGLPFVLYFLREVLPWRS